MIILFPFYHGDASQLYGVGSKDPTPPQRSASVCIDHKNFAESILDSFLVAKRLKVLQLRFVNNPFVKDANEKESSAFLEIIK